VKKGVLTVRHNEHNVADTVGGNEVSCRVWKTRGKIPGAQIRLPGPAFPGGYGTTNPIFFFTL
jgi:hypothetical protein